MMSSTDRSTYYSMLVKTEAITEELNKDQTTTTTKDQLKQALSEIESLKMEVNALKKDNAALTETLYSTYKKNIQKQHYHH